LPAFCDADADADADTDDVEQVVAVGGGLEHGVEGQPLANSHYGYHMVMWHTVLALSGQHYDAPSQALSFRPKLPRSATSSVNDAPCSHCPRQRLCVSA
jgi:protein-disulfide isomerase-like protein with CxxC motif